MNIDELRQALHTLNSEDAFRPRFGTDQWRFLGPYLTRKEIAAGEMLIREGERERCMYLVERGSLQVFVNNAAPGVAKIAILRAGSVVGEPALFTDSPRMANVEAMTPSVVWALLGPRFEEMTQRVPSVALEFLRAAGSVMAVRMRSNMTRPVPMP